MHTTLWKTTLTLALGTLLFTGCELSDTGTEDLGTTSFDSSGGSSSMNDSLSVVPANGNTGFLVVWTKRAGGYGEVIYTDDLSKPRGNGYPLTANYTGTYSMPCTMSSHDASSASFTCKPSNVSYSKGVTLRTGVPYKWLVNYGFDHTKGEVEAVMEYQGDGTITVE
jgi:hypothetical protein